jgi:hypothetical protein
LDWASAEINACGHCDAVLRSIESLHLNAESQMLHTLVQKVDALQPPDLAFLMNRA